MRPTSFRIRDVLVAPNLLLAPMEGVTDVVFRRLVRQIGGCGLTTTEFVPGAALARADERVVRVADLDPDERPAAIQIYGRDPETMAEGARVVEALGATVCDINMGCPSKRVCRNSGGSALMKEPELAARIVRAVRAAITIPLTVKMRSGFDPANRNAPELAWICQEEGAEAITIHWRTRADLFGGERDVRAIAAAKARVQVPVIANGDILDPASALEMFDETGCDAVMIGRGAMRNPWVFLQVSDALDGRVPREVGASEKRDALLGFLDSQRSRSRTEGAALGRFKAVAKHFFDGRDPRAQEVRARVLRSESIDAAKAVAREWFAELEAGELTAA